MRRQCKFAATSMNVAIYHGQILMVDKEYNLHQASLENIRRGAMEKSGDAPPTTILTNDIYEFTVCTKLGLVYVAFKSIINIMNKPFQGHKKQKYIVPYQLPENHICYCLLVVGPILVAAIFKPSDPAQHNKVTYRFLSQLYLRDELTHLDKSINHLIFTPHKLISIERQTSTLVLSIANFGQMDMLLIDKSKASLIVKDHRISNNCTWSIASIDRPQGIDLYYGTLKSIYTCHIDI